MVQDFWCNILLENFLSHHSPRQMELGSFSDTQSPRRGSSPPDRDPFEVAGMAFSVFIGIQTALWVEQFAICQPD